MKSSFYFLNPVFFFGLVLVLSAGFFLAIKMAFSPDKESKKSEDALKKAVSDKDAAEKELKTFKDGSERELKTLQEETASLKKELSLKTQMFEGLKGQYDELEKDYEKLAQKAQEAADKDKPQAGPPQVIKPEPDKDKTTGLDKNEPETKPPQTSA